MSDHILLHENTRTNLSASLQGEHHAILLIGLEGSGKFFTACYAAAQLLSIPRESVQTNPAVYIVMPNDGTIGVDSIREIRHFLQLKTFGASRFRRVLIVKDAQFMTIEAQNALLKILEEPPEDTFIIITADTPNSLRSTIRSRVQTIHIVKPLKDEVLKHFKDTPENSTVKAYQISGGRIGIMTQLMDNAETQSVQLISSIQLAKTILTETRYERLLRVDALSKDRQHVENLIQALKVIAKGALAECYGKKQAQIIRWHKMLETIYDTEKLLIHKPNLKLLLDNLFINL